MGKKILKILLILLLIIVILAGWLVYKHWNSIIAFKDAVQYSQEELDTRLQQNKDDVQKFIDEKEDITVRDLTEEESKALNEGNMSEEEIIKIITGQSTPPKEETPVKNETPAVTEKPQQNSAEGTSSISGNAENTTTTKASQNTDKSVGQKVSEAIAKLYVQKSIYLNKLDAVEAEVRAYFEGLEKQKHQDKIKFPEEERQAVKQQLLTEYLPRVAAWESECDNIVYGILDEIKAALKESGGDTSIVTKLEESYLNEKKTKKSYFINRYMD